MHPRLQHLQALTRRQFFRDSQVGSRHWRWPRCWTRGLGCDRASVRRSARAQEAALPGQGEAGHLPAHDRLAAAARPVRLQARAGQAQRPALPRRVPQGQAVRVHHGHAQAARHARASSRSTARAARGCRDAIPHLHEVADELVRDPVDEHRPVQPRPGRALLYTGSPRSGRPSMGSWVTYGLGTENQNLPGFVVLISSGVQPNGGKSSFGQRLPAHRSTRACSAARRATRSSTSSDPPGMDRDDAPARASTPCATSTSCRPASSATPRR